jgi:hypothetical protein
MQLAEYLNEYLDLIITSIGTEIESMQSLPDWAKRSMPLRDMILNALQREATNREEPLAAFVQAIIEGAESRFMNGVADGLHRVIIEVIRSECISA